MTLCILITVLTLASGNLAEDPSAMQHTQEMMDFIKWQRMQSINLDASKKEESLTEKEKDGNQASSAKGSSAVGGPISGGSGFQQYMDYSKYMGAGGSSATGNGSPGAGAGFQQYMDYSKYMGAGGASATGGGSPGGGSGFQQYMDYSKYMGAGGASNPGAGPTDLTSTAGGASEDFMSKYSGKDWDSFQDHMNAYQNVPFSAAECKTVEELMLWRQKQLDTAHNFIPGAYQGFVVDQVEKDTQLNLKRLESEKKEQNATGLVASSVPAPTDSHEDLANSQDALAKAMEVHEKSTQALEQLAKEKAAFEESKKAFMKLQASVKQEGVKLERPQQEMETLASQEPSGHSYNIITLFACLCLASAAAVGLGLVPSLTRRFPSRSDVGLYMPLQADLPVSIEEPMPFFERLRQQFSARNNVEEEAPAAWSAPGTDGDLV
mmetsp:Transcript_85512/g.151316  ORF Transcript_85512/g.151316 Transcript_85512/m.151316 type:complete len:436 (-) Transcript_85512:427-1734(-)|eukprot:CAMPEP_0197626250 /NCGR_PEP_ID=MMETSP1338-20131121/5303_1 /TAXON_ID=43686 ORGANISM="Pelagodinium beii, Strain RCC1491" /NCGR_SAMPLE_ID=MMETSP1338 /ASSEMBLY_ACC=CAM_ASM_000754 /LENGTH=435 /DNA_ID=CAMNT_0043196773 /DNA_START=1 /DNA_END=1308 /DNA_ORIENTATION=+